MKRLTTLTLLAVLAATPALAQTIGGDNPSTRGGIDRAGFSAAADDGDPIGPTSRPAMRRLTALDGPDGDPMAATVEQWSEWADIVCGGDSLIIYDIDENGDPTNVRTSCLDD